MSRFIISRLLQAVPTLWVIATITFFMTRLLPVVPLMQSGQFQEIKVKLQSHFGLDQPLFKQYLLYLKNLLQAVI